jgi:excisionase family DNA binding protein
MEACAVADVPRFLTVEQAGKLLQLGRSKTYELTVEWERSGGRSGIPFVWFGNQKRIPLDGLMRWVDAQLDRPPAA